MITAAEVRRHIAELGKKKRVKRGELQRIVGDVRRGERATGGVKALELRSKASHKSNDD